MLELTGRAVRRSTTPSGDRSQGERMACETALPDRGFDVPFDPDGGVLHRRLGGFRAARAGRSAELTAGFDSLGQQGGTGHGGCTATVIASRLDKMQAERALTSDRCACSSTWKKQDNG